ncbi:MAG: hypothetical protein NC819_03710 [Candidatus Omnitrophica bacterium]|nr:hypothetical protein [Candidatus Omnitrophota bacterium]
MKKTTSLFLTQIAAIFISLAIGLTPPAAFALRPLEMAEQQAGLEDLRQALTAGLEELPLADLNLEDVPAAAKVQPASFPENFVAIPPQGIILPAESFSLRNGLGLYVGTASDPVLLRYDFQEGQFVILTRDGEAVLQRAAEGQTIRLEEGPNTIELTWKRPSPQEDGVIQIHVAGSGYLLEEHVRKHQRALRLLEAQRDVFNRLTAAGIRDPYRINLYTAARAGVLPQQADHAVIDQTVNEALTRLPDIDREEFNEFMDTVQISFVYAAEPELNWQVLGSIGAQLQHRNVLVALQMKINEVSPQKVNSLPALVKALARRSGVDIGTSADHQFVTFMRQVGGGVDQTDFWGFDSEIPDGLEADKLVRGRFQDDQWKLPNNHFRFTTSLLTLSAEVPALYQDQWSGVAPDVVYDQFSRNLHRITTADSLTILVPGVATPPPLPGILRRTGSWVASETGKIVNGRKLLDVIWVTKQPLDQVLTQIASEANAQAGLEEFGEPIGADTRLPVNSLILHGPAGQPFGVYFVNADEGDRVEVSQLNLEGVSMQVSETVLLRGDIQEKVDWSYLPAGLVQETLTRLIRQDGIVNLTSQDWRLRAALIFQNRVAWAPRPFVGDNLALQAEIAARLGVPGETVKKILFGETSSAGLEESISVQQLLERTRAVTLADGSRVRRLPADTVLQIPERFFSTSSNAELHVLMGVVQGPDRIYRGPFITIFRLSGDNFSLVPETRESTVSVRGLGEGSDFLIGRFGANLDDVDITVGEIDLIPDGQGGISSGRHMRISRSGGIISVRDYPSRHGTYLLEADLLRMAGASPEGVQPAGLAVDFQPLPQQIQYRGNPLLLRVPVASGREPYHFGLYRDRRTGEFRMYRFGAASAPRVLQPRQWFRVGTISEGADMSLYGYSLKDLNPLSFSIRVLPAGNDAVIEFRDFSARVTMSAEPGAVARFAQSVQVNTQNIPAQLNDVDENTPVRQMLLAEGENFALLPDLYPMNRADQYGYTLIPWTDIPPEGILFRLGSTQFFRFQVVRQPQDPFPAAFQNLGKIHWRVIHLATGRVVDRGFGPHDLYFGTKVPSSEWATQVAISGPEIEPFHASLFIAEEGITITDGFNQIPTRAGTWVERVTAAAGLEEVRDTQGNVYTLDTQLSRVASQSQIFRGQVDDRDVILKVFRLEGVQPYHVKTLVWLVEQLRRIGVPSVDMEVVELQDGRAGIRMPLVPQSMEQRAMALMSSGGKSYGQVTNELRAMAEEILFVIRHATQAMIGTFRSLADERSSATGQYVFSQQYANFGFVGDTLVDFDPIDMSELMAHMEQQGTNRPDATLQEIFPGFFNRRGLEERVREAQSRFDQMNAQYGPIIQAGPDAPEQGLIGYDRALSIVEDARRRLRLAEAVLAASPSAGLEAKPPVLVQTLSREQFQVLFPGVDIPADAGRIFLIPGNAQTTVNLYADVTLLNNLEQAIGRERGELPQGVNVVSATVPDTKEIFEAIVQRPGALFWHWLTGERFEQNVLPEALLDNSQPLPRLVSLVLFALQGPGAKLEEVIGTLTFKDAQENVYHAYFA